MRLKTRRVFSGVLATGCIAGMALACGTPPVPPPPPPPPPIICCQVIEHFVDPCDRTRECIIIRYFRRDGLPLFQSNPMPLLPGQRCLCTLPGLPLIAIQKGAVLVGTTFGDPKNIPWQGLPPSVPPYEPGRPVPPDPDDPVKQQIQQAYGLYLEAARQDPTQDIRPPEGGDPCEVFDVTPNPDTTNPVCNCDLNGDFVIDFQDCDEYEARLNAGETNLPDCDGDGVSGTAADLSFLCNTQTDCPPTTAGGPVGGGIPPGVMFDIYQKLSVPRGFDPRCLCDPNQIWILGLFLDDNGIVFVEPGQPGDGTPTSQYNPFTGDSGAIMKFRWYWPAIPSACPPFPCPGDANQDGVVAFSDVTSVLGNWLRRCCPDPNAP